MLKNEPQLKTLVGGLEPRQLAAMPYSNDDANYFILRKTRDVKSTLVP